MNMYEVGCLMVYNFNNKIVQGWAEYIIFRLLWFTSFISIYIVAEHKI